MHGLFVYCVVNSKFESSVTLIFVKRNVPILVPHKNAFEILIAVLFVAFIRSARFEAFYCSPLWRLPKVVSRVVTQF